MHQLMHDIPKLDNAALGGNAESEDHDAMIRPAKSLRRGSFVARCANFSDRKNAMALPGSKAAAVPGDA